MTRDFRERWPFNSKALKNGNYHFKFNLKRSFMLNIIFILCKLIYFKVLIWQLIIWRLSLKPNNFSFNEFLISQLFFSIPEGGSRSSLGASTPGWSGLFHPWTGWALWVPPSFQHQQTPRRSCCRRLQCHGHVRIYILIEFVSFS